MQLQAIIKRAFALPSTGLTPPHLCVCFKPYVMYRDLLYVQRVEVRSDHSCFRYWWNC